MGQKMADKNSKNKVTDWRIIGVSGDTMDGRQISADELKQMAESYDPAVYGARINLEHCYYTFPGWAGGYGDVLELKAEPWHKDESRTALLARLSVLPNLQELWDEGEKIYTSMEIAPDFAKSGRAYLVGLAITDRPASLGTTANFSVAAAQAEKGKTFTPYHLDGITAAGTVQADDRIAATVIVWMIDCGLLDEAMPLADVLIHSGLESADEYSRSMPEIIVEQMADQIESGSEISAENLKTLIEWATAKKEDGLHEINLADVIRAKLLKAAGEKAEAADDNETALTLCPGCMSGLGFKRGGEAVAHGGAAAAWTRVNNCRKIEAAAETAAIYPIVIKKDGNYDWEAIDVLDWLAANELPMPPGGVVGRALREEYRDCIRRAREEFNNAAGLSQAEVDKVMADVAAAVKDGRQMAEKRKVWQELTALSAGFGAVCYGQRLSKPKPKSDDEISGERPRRYLPMPKKWTTDDVVKRSEAVRKGAAEWLERMRRM